MNSGFVSGYGQRVLFLGAHPDDIEIGCGGTAAKFKAEGRAIAFAIASFAPGNGGLREQEAKAAAAKLNLSEVSNTLFFGRIPEDTLLAEKNQLRIWMRDVSKRFQPDTVFVHRPDGHDHHSLVSEIAAGCFLTQAFYQFFIPRTEPEPGFTPTAFVDIENYIQKKIEMCACHGSQSPKYISEDAIRSTAHFYYNRCDALQSDGKAGYVEAFITIRSLTPVGPPTTPQETSTGLQAHSLLLPNRHSPPGSGVNLLVLVSRFLRTLNAEQFLGSVRRRAALSYLTYLHEDVVHQMRKFALACEYCGSTEEWNEDSWAIFGPAAADFCSACRKLFCDLTELEDNQIHCCLKLIGNSESVVTWARSEPTDYRDETLSHLINQNTVWSALLGQNDGKRNWDLFNCFSSSNLVKYSEQYKNTRLDWKDHYKSVLVFPLRYTNHRGITKFDTFGFLAFDSKKADAFTGMPEIFEHISEKDVYQDEARKCAMFQAGAAIADTLSMFLRPIFIRHAQQ